MLHVFATASDGTVTYVNRAAADRLGCEPATLEGSSFLDRIAPGARPRATALLRSRSGEETLDLVALDGRPFTLRLFALAGPGDTVVVVGEPDVPAYLRLGEELVAVANDLSVVARERRRDARQALRKAGSLEEALTSLKESFWHIRRERDVLPICVGCGRVSTEDGRWETLLDFLHRTTTFLSHGYCDTCAAEFKRTEGSER